MLNKNYSKQQKIIITSTFFSNSYDAINHYKLLGVLFSTRAYNKFVNKTICVFHVNDLTLHDNDSDKIIFLISVYSLFRIFYFD